MNATTRTVLAVALCLSAACAQEQKPQPPANPPDDAAAAVQQALAEMRKAFADAGLQVDEKTGTVSLPVAVNILADPLEYLLIHRKGKGHEALFVTQCKPSVLNGALMFIGLEQGKNAGYREKDPPPTLEEIEAGADPVIVTPPEGRPFWITARWQDKDGKQHEVAVEDLLLELSTGEPMGLASWVFLGGRMAPLYKNEPPVFVADFEGNLISICYLDPPNHLATMSHERARDDQNWWRTDLCPEPGVEATLVFWRDKPKLVEERERRLAEAARQKAPADKDGAGKAPAAGGK